MTVCLPFASFYYLLLLLRLSPLELIPICTLRVSGVEEAVPRVSSTANLLQEKLLQCSHIAATELKDLLPESKMCT
jgi:hypothetical protein